MGIFGRKKMMERQLRKEAHGAIYEMDEEAEIDKKQRSMLRQGFTQQRKNKAYEQRSVNPQRGIKFATRVKTNLMRK